MKPLGFDFKFKYNDLKRFSQVADMHLHEATTEALNLLWGEIPSYPPATGKPMIFKSLKQAIFVKASIAEGKMEVPYRRTVQLGRSINKRIDVEGGWAKHRTYVGAIGTNVVYAPFVISKEEVDTRSGKSGPQAFYHMNNWYTLQEVLEKNMDKVKKIYKKAVEDIMMDMMK